MSQNIEHKDGHHRAMIGFIVLCILAVSLIALVVLGVMGKEEPASEGPATMHHSSPAPQSTGTEESIYTAACGYEPQDRAKPDASFATTRMKTDSGLAVATATGIGPCEINPVPHGYAFTPKGALLSAVNVVATMTGHPEKSDIAQYQLSTSPMREKILAQGGSEIGQVRPVTVEGFKTVMVNDFEFTVDIAFSSPDTLNKVYAVSLTVVWDDHDWRIFMPESGPKGYPVTDLKTEGFQVWGF